MGASSRLTPETVLWNYLRAKDENRPFLLAGVFSPDAKLQVFNHASTIAFPARAEGREAIADILVRSFGRTYENVYSFYLGRPTRAARRFSCDWLVAMTEKDNRGVRVGCGRYDWAFEARAPGLAVDLVITIEAMQVLSPDALDRTFDWVQQLSYPWSSASAVIGTAPRSKLLAPVMRYLGRRAGGA